MERSLPHESYGVSQSRSATRRTGGSVTRSRDPSSRLRAVIAPVGHPGPDPGQHARVLPGRDRLIFAGFTMFDFQRLRASTDIASAPLLAASIFLDIVNVFLFFLEIFAGGRE